VVPGSHPCRMQAQKNTVKCDEFTFGILSFSRYLSRGWTNGNDVSIPTRPHNGYVSATASLCSCKILGFHGGKYEKCLVLGCGAVRVLLEPTFRRNAGDNKTQMAPHPRRRRSSVFLLGPRSIRQFSSFGLLLTRFA
jgi:hypothetical protein